VTISDSVITGNTVASQQYLPAGFRGPIDCSFASGGGIFNEGNLTLVNTRVSGNHSRPGAATVFANGAGIENTRRGVLTVVRSVITGNTDVASPDSGLGAVGGGIANFSRTAVDHTVIIGNQLTANGTDGSADGGGIWNGDPGVGRTPSLSAIHPDPDADRREPPGSVLRLLIDE